MSGYPTSSADPPDDSRGAMGRRLSIALASLWLAGSLATPSRADSHHNIRFEHLSIADGLSQSAVYAILQDREGYLWFGTEDGLNRFDGYEFTVYQSEFDDPSSLSHDWILSLLEDERGDIWVGTSGGGLNRWNRKTDTFTHFGNDPTNPNSLTNDIVRSLFEASDGSLWVGTDGGLNRFRDDGGFDHYKHNPSNSDSLLDNSVWTIAEGIDGALWVGTTEGLNRFRAEGDGFEHLQHDPNDEGSLPSGAVRSIFQEASGTLWVGTFGGGLGRLDGDGRFETYRHDDDGTSIAHDRVRAIYQDSQGMVWIGTEGGLTRWDPRSERFSSHFNEPGASGSLSDNHIISISEDRGGVLWLGTIVGGLNRTNIVAGTFDHIKQSAGGLSHNGVFSFADDRDFLWVGTFGGGLNRYDRATGSFEHYRHDPKDPSSLSDDRVMSLLVDSEGTLWVGTFSAGLNRYDPGTGRFIRYRHDPDDPRSLSHDGVKFIREDSKKTLWIGTHRGGLNRFDRESETFVSYAHDPNDPTSLSHNSLTDFWEADDGVLWLGTNGGLNRFDPEVGTFAHYRHDPLDPASLSHDFVTSLIGDRRGTLWVGTQGGGLNRWSIIDRRAHRGAFKHYTARDGLPNDFIYGIVEGSDDMLWLSTNRGLSRMSPLSETFRNYDSAHGLQSDEFNFGAYHRGADGTLFFGGVNGFNSFHPRDVRGNLHVPPIVLTNFLKLNQRVPLHENTSGRNGLDEIQIGYRDYVVTFEYAALDFTAPSKNRYAYKLEGFDQEWNEVGNIRRATYTNLDPGDYVFRVRGSNNDGLWNEEGMAIQLSVDPPPWQTWWAYAIYAALSAALLTALATSQKRKFEQKVEHARELEREVAARTAELEEGNRKLAQLNEKLQEASLTDSLTGLRNRRYVVDHIEQDVSLVLRSYHRNRESGGELPTEDLILMMVDLDGYKLVNDRHGHAAGGRGPGTGERDPRTGVPNVGHSRSLGWRRVSRHRKDV